jgi:hypothetical protein
VNNRTISSVLSIVVQHDRWLFRGCHFGAVIAEASSKRRCECFASFAHFAVKSFLPQGSQETSQPLTA